MAAYFQTQRHPCPWLVWYCSCAPIHFNAAELQYQSCSLTRTSYSAGRPPPRGQEMFRYDASVVFTASVFLPYISLQFVLSSHSGRSAMARDLQVPNQHFKGLSSCKLLMAYS
ncbi:hypothetical protein GDO78_021330 [Eleutherodactylus coqui]|uniref:Uncharacterized protein n=1 Tax=Eleutherodactylus coqui TaxID=57060 RepID=A0A8J6BHR2_ELECQ|nr:hypothetical protein GDO78_021330 [Eleutherodactylus coqui]